MWLTKPNLLTSLVCILVSVSILIRVSKHTTPGNLLEFENPQGNPRNLEFNGPLGNSVK